jgi:hypothetical protein
LNLSPKYLGIHAVGINHPEIGVAPGMISDLEKRICNELHGFVRMRKHLSANNI